MGFFDGIKQFFGVGGVDVALDCQPQVAKGSGVLQGAVTLTAKSDQQVLTVDVKLVEEWTTGRGDEKETKEFELGKVQMPGMELKKGEQRVVQFQLPFSLIKSNADQLKEHGGALGALGSMAAFANNEKSLFTVVAEADVKGTALDPSAKRQIQLV